MITSIRKIYPLYIFIDFVLIWSSFIIPYFLKYNAITDIFRVITLPNLDQYIFIFVLWTIFIVSFFQGKGLYATDRSLPIPKEMARVALNLFYVSVIMAAIIFFAQYKFFSRKVFLENFLSLCFLLGGWRVIKRLILRKLIAGGFHNINVLIVGAGKVGGVVLEEIRQNPQWGFHIVGFLDDRKEEIDGFPVLGKVRDFPSVARKHFVDEIVVTIPSVRELIGDIIKKAKTMHLGVRIVPENFEGPLSFIEINYMGIIPLLTYKQRKHHPTEFALKRLFDIMLSFVFIVLSSPLFVVISLLIKWDSPGPVFYVQQRVGLKGKRFNLFKFRSMFDGAEQMKSRLLNNNEVKDGVIFKMKKDPRVTRFGKLLRKYSLDELPQLFNVFKGDMSLVGPRPPTPDEVEQYQQQDLQRLSIRPGVTCISQVRGRSDLSFKRWVKWDLWYINNWSFGLDMQILLWTVPAVIKGKGAY